MGEDRIQCSIRLEDFDEGALTLMAKQSPDVDEFLKDAADKVRDKARASSAFKDKSGKLRKSIKVKKSKYDGYIVYASRPQAWLIEHGHALIKKGRVVGHVPAHPFLRPAVASVAQELTENVK